MKLNGYRALCYTIEMATLKVFEWLTLQQKPE